MWLNLFATSKEYSISELDFKDLEAKGSELLNYVGKGHDQGSFKRAFFWWQLVG